MKQLIWQLIVCGGMVSCATSNTAQVKDASSLMTTDTSELTIFVLERDIPPTIKRLGTVSIPYKVTTFNLGQLDAQVKAKLSESCKAAGANGAYRVQEGTYSPYVVSYLMFHYDR